MDSRASRQSGTDLIEREPQQRQQCASCLSASHRLVSVTSCERFCKSPINNCYRGNNNTLGRSSCSRLTAGLCSMLLMSIDAVLARRDWPEFMVGVAAVWVMAGSKGGGGGGGWGMEAFGFSRPLGLSIMVWILSSADTKIITGGKFQFTPTVFCLFCTGD